jgi:hypothetical protein
MNHGRLSLAPAKTTLKREGRGSRSFGKNTNASTTVEERPFQGRDKVCGIVWASSPCGSIVP